MNLILAELVPVPIYLEGANEEFCSIGHLKLVCHKLV